jgi:hypothetical protein
MAESEDTWPSPHYNPGSSKHVHALGVISVCYCAFERGVDGLFELPLIKQNPPKKLIDTYYFGLSEEKRISAIRDVFNDYEQDKAVIAAVDNLLEYFQWCRDVRNKLLHAEHYPPLFGGDSETLHLTKREGKRDPKQVYVVLGLQRLRTLADKVQAGRVQCAKIRIYLRARGKHVHEFDHGLMAYMHESLPEKLTVPRPLRLLQRPPSEALELTP